VYSHPIPHHPLMRTSPSLIRTETQRCTKLSAYVGHQIYSIITGALSSTYLQLHQYSWNFLALSENANALVPSSQYRNSTGGHLHDVGILTYINRSVERDAFCVLPIITFVFLLLRPGEKDKYLSGKCQSHRRVPVPCSFTWQPCFDATGVSETLENRESDAVAV